MKVSIQLAALVLTICLVGCAANSMKQTWKSPSYQGGPVKKVAIIAVDERGLVRQGFENRFARDLKARGQQAIVTHDLMSLPEIKADKEAAAAKLREADVDAVLIVRLADINNYNRSVRASGEMYVGTVTGMSTGYGWYDYYTVAFTDMGTVWSSDKKTVYLDSSLYTLKEGGRVWSGLTETVLKDGDDALIEVDTLIAMVVKDMGRAAVTR